jgi:hypothetical protein
MLHARADMVILRTEKDLRLVAHTPKIHREDDPTDIAFIVGPHRTRLDRLLTAKAGAAAGRKRTEPVFLFLFEQSRQAPGWFHVHTPPDDCLIWPTFLTTAYLTGATMSIMQPDHAFNHFGSIQTGKMRLDRPEWLYFM